MRIMLELKIQDFDVLVQTIDTALATATSEDRVTLRDIRHRMAKGLAEARNVK